MKVLDLEGIKVKWLGHSSFKFATDNLVIYIDPYQIHEHEKADIILITHGHYDHCSLEDVKKIVKDETWIVSTPDTTSKFSGKIDGGHLKLVKPGDELNHMNVNIKAVPAYNLHKPFHPGDNDWVGYVFRIKNLSFYHAGDTDHIPEMKQIRADVAMLPVSGTYVMDPQEATEAARNIMPKVAIPMHYGKIVGDKKDAEKFKELCKFCDVRIMD